MPLPPDLLALIFSHYSLKKLQIWHQNNPYLLSEETARSLIFLNYGVTLIPLPILTPFEQYSNYAMHASDVGYLGQFYLPIRIILFNSVKHRDLELINYYLVRFFNTQTGANALANSTEQMYMLAQTCITLATIHFPEAVATLQQYFNVLTPAAVTTLQQYHSVLKLASQFNTINKVTKLLTSVIRFFTNLNPTIMTVDDDTFLGSIPSLLRIALKENAIFTTNDLELVSKLSTLIDDFNDVNQWPFANQWGFYNMVKASIDILLNKDINVIIGWQEASDLLFFALTVANSKIVDKIPRHIVIKNMVDKIIVFVDRFFDPDHARRYEMDYVDSVISEVLYDINYNPTYTNNIIFVNNTSKYLANPLKFRDDVAILKLLNNINSYQQGRSGLAPRIFDAETALRLSKIVNIKRYLHPVTPFSRDAMRQAELLPYQY